MLENYSIFPPDISSIANFLSCSRAHGLVLFSGKLFGMRITMTGATWLRYGLQKRSALPSVHPAETAVEHNSGANTAIPLSYPFPRILCRAVMHLYQSHHTNVNHEAHHINQENSRSYEGSVREYTF